MTAIEQVVDLPFSIAPPLPHIREFQEADAAAVARMWRESAAAWPGGGPAGGEHSTAARVRQEQHELNTVATFIAWAPDPDAPERDGAVQRAVGYCSLYEQPSDATAAYVGTLSAHPGWHGQGVGRDLLKAALERTVALGYNRLDLNTWAGNLKAVPLYKKSGYFWVPDTSVRMENYLPLIFRLPPAQAFFATADWYRDFRRDLSLRPDEEKQGKLEVYTYAWEHDQRRLQVTIDRTSRGVVALDTEGFSISTTVDDPRLPAGGRREARWRMAVHGAAGLPVSLLAEGEDSVRCTLQSSVLVEGEHEWVAPVTAEQPPITSPWGRPANRVRSTVVVAGQAVPLALGMQLVQPVDVVFDAGGLNRRWLSPGDSRRVTVAVENALDEPVRGTLRLAVPSALALDRSDFALDLGPRRRVSFPLTITAGRPGLHTLRAQAMVEAGESGGELRTRVFEQSVLCGEPGEVFVEQTAERVRVVTDRHRLTFPLQPTRDWMARFTVDDRASGERILSHSAALGPPFAPSLFASSTWTPRVERSGAAVTVTLGVAPAALPGLTFERVARISPSGLIRMTYRVINAGPGERAFQVGAGTSVDLGMVSGTQVAAPLASGLVVDDAGRFPDWEEPELGRPERYAETWMAEFGGGWVGATMWQGAREVFAGWESPSLNFDLGAIPPGGQAETPALYLYAGQGDWQTARALWRQLLGPEGAAAQPAGQPALRLRLERFAFETATAETRLLLESERARTMGGRVTLEVDGQEVARGEAAGLQTGAPRSIPVRLQLPERATALKATVSFDHQHELERVETAVLRAGLAGTPVRLSAQGAGAATRLRLENGPLRLTAVPATLGRLVELSVQDASGSWVNQLFAAGPGPDTFVWFNPWYGGVHPVIQAEGTRGHPGRLQEESFTWEETERTGAQGLRWQGFTASMLATSRDLVDLHLAVSYLVTGGGNVLATVERLENRSRARVSGELSLSHFLQPGGDRRQATLYFERDGQLRHHKRVHGGSWGSASGWCAVVAPSGPALAVVRGSPGGSIPLRDMGLEGAHPDPKDDYDLAPGEVKESITYLVVAQGLEEAHRYRVLAGAGLV